VCTYPASKPNHERRRKGNPMPGGITDHTIPGCYKHGNLALQGEGVSDEIVIYGYGSCGTQTSERFHFKLQISPLVKEGVLHEEQINCKITDNSKSGHGLQWGPRHQDELAN
jgi:hypothetical protein